MTNDVLVNSYLLNQKEAVTGVSFLHYKNNINLSIKRPSLFTRD